MTDEVETVKVIRSIDDLTPDPGNANEGTERGRAILDKSLRTYGAGRSILADREGVVIAGNKTLEVAEDLKLPVKVVQTDGTELVVVQRTDLSLAEDAKAQELGVADNRASEVGLQWDAQALAAIAQKADLSSLFTADEMRKLVARAAKPDAEPQFDRAEELQKKWGVRRGQLWGLGRVAVCPRCGKVHKLP